MSTSASSLADNLEVEVFFLALRSFPAVYNTAFIALSPQS